MTTASILSASLVRNRTFVASVVLLAAAIAAPTFLYPIFLMNALCFALFACAFNLLMGYGGLLSFGHAAFFGGAGYVTAYCARDLGFPALAAIAAGTLSAVVLGALFGFIAVRKRGIYFGMVTLGLSQIVYFIALQTPVTGGEDGMQGVPRGTLFGVLDLRNDLTMYYVVLAIFLLGFLASYRIIHSPFGKTMKAVRDDPTRALSLGYDIDRYRVLAFTLSAALSGLAGGTKSIALQLASLTDVDWSMSGEVVLIALVGGVGTTLGPVVGAFVVIGMQHYLAEFGPWVKGVQGLIFIACVLAFRRGIVGELGALLYRGRRRGMSR